MVHLFHTCAKMTTLRLLTNRLFLLRQTVGNIRGFYLYLLRIDQLLNFICFVCFSMLKQKKPLVLTMLAAIKFMLGSIKMMRTPRKQP